MTLREASWMFWSVWSVELDLEVFCLTEDDAAELHAALDDAGYEVSIREPKETPE